MPETALALLIVKGAEPHQICIACSQQLEARGMLRRVRERPINERMPDYVTTWFEIAEPYSLTDCQFMIADCHVGHARKT